MNNQGLGGKKFTNGRNQKEQAPVARGYMPSIQFLSKFQVRVKSFKFKPFKSVKL